MKSRGLGDVYKRQTKLHTDVKNGAEVKPMKLFILSNNYLAALFLALSIDAVLGLPTLL